MQFERCSVIDQQTLEKNLHECNRHNVGQEMNVARYICRQDDKIPRQNIS